MCVCVFLSMGVWLEYGGYCQKAFLLLAHASPGLLATGERSLLDIIFPVPFTHFRLANSTAPRLGYMGGNKETQGNHCCTVSRVLRPPGSPSSFSHRSEAPCACLLCYAHVFSCKKEGPQGMGVFLMGRPMRNSIFVRNRSCTSFYSSNFNTLFFKMFSYLIFILYSNQSESTELYFINIHFPRISRHRNESQHLFKITLC